VTLFTRMAEMWFWSLTWLALTLYHGSMNNRYHMQPLANGLIFVHDRKTGLTACYNGNGTYRNGDLSGVGIYVVRWLADNVWPMPKVVAR